MDYSFLHIITSFYLPDEENRRNEILLTLGKNIESPNVKTIHLFLDNDDAVDYLQTEYKSELETGKIHIIRIGRQPIVAEMIIFANIMVGKICMILNADIWLHSISDLALFENMEGKLYGLTRHESNMHGRLIDRYDQGPGFVGSQDAFVFKSPVKQQVIEKTNFHQNVWGSDNVILREFQTAGYKLYNPCRQIITVHEHSSQVRNENRQRLPPPWTYLKPCYITLNDGNNTDNNILNLKQSNNYLIDKIKSNEPFLISRIGVEAQCSYSFLKNNCLYENIISTLETYNGIYFNQDNKKQLLELYAKIYADSLKNSIAMAYFDFMPQHIEKQDFFCDKFKLDKIHSRSIEPFYIMEEGEIPWTHHLKGKKVLIVHPFIDTIKKQKESGFKLFGEKDIFLEEQELCYYKTFNTLAGNHIHEHWFETFKIMCMDIAKIDFDIALVACGGYGMPICNFIKGKLNKSAIYVGGGLQLFFGIMGKRWEKSDFWVKHIDKYGTQFVRPNEDEIVKDKEKVEGGCYW